MYAMKKAQAHICPSFYPTDWPQWVLSECFLNCLNGRVSMMYSSLQESQRRLIHFRSFTEGSKILMTYSNHIDLTLC